ncbi:MAG: hypothetical protein RLO18_14110, partial [Gimesia chilikensis]
MTRPLTAGKSRRLVAGETGETGGNRGKPRGKPGQPQLLTVRLRSDRVARDMARKGSRGPEL